MTPAQSRQARAAPGERRPPAPRRGLLDRLLAVLAIAYPLALLAVVLAFRFIGEASWITAAGIYLPRVGFALPWPILTLALIWRGPRRLLVTSAVALAL